MAVFCQRGDAMSVSNNMLQLEANMPKEVYDKFMQEAGKKQESLQKSIQFFYQLPDTICLLSEDEFRPYMRQQDYPEVPFCDPTKGDNDSSVASSGCALVVTEFIGEHFHCANHVEIPQMASLAVKLGYRGYKKLEDGSWKKMGMKHVWFDNFVPNFYNLQVTRMEDILQVNRALKTRRLSVLLVKDSVYKQKEESTDSHFVVIVGNQPKDGTFQVYDPEYPTIISVPCSQVIGGVRNGWIVAEN